ncbi:type II toxin-antitoxin system VapC family toxin [Parvibaculum sp.]|uniref:type II toxin-antitoxin system VapC family toxin n=1 Tax=Parvibaculum sp. TaxID=2024848 RepID=UPI000C8A4F5A|nr:hypothetical protein [Parvibaculum sp.]|tara:strand:+ start:1792 stop:2031 length:240 start_codon:yes stop_codon:yes gene_type:complete
MTTLLDTNILIYALGENEQHHHWAQEELEKRKSSGPLVIPEIVYCEFSIGMPSQEAVDVAVGALGLERYASPNEALFRA